MKLCQLCDSGYHDSHATCPTHGGILHEIRELKPGMTVRQTYRIVRKLGQGGFGTVYLADHTFMEEQRALKFLSAEWAADAAVTSRFRREVKTLRQIRHRNVVDCGDLEPAEDDSLFFSMEFVEGPDLWDFLRQAPKPFDVALALEITRGIAEGLSAAHALGMVHRDIKPENILMARVGDTWVPKIADFGIVATKESGDQRTRTKTGGTLLTMAYAAPEQWRGVPAAELDGRTDLYALGGVLFEMLTGETAFSARNYEGWAEQHKNAEPRRPSSLRPELARWAGLDELVIWMLAKTPEQRPETIARVIESLEMIRNRRETPDQPPQADQEQELQRDELEEPYGLDSPEALDEFETLAGQEVEEPEGETHRSLKEKADLPASKRPLLKWLMGFGMICVMLMLGGEALQQIATSHSRSGGAQTNSGKLVGTVTDHNGSPVRNVAITLYDTLEAGPEGQPKVRVTHTDEAGNYEFSSLPDSVAFFASAEAQGFVKSEDSAGVVKQYETTRKDFVLDRPAKVKKHSPYDFSNLRLSPSKQ